MSPQEERDVKKIKVSAVKTSRAPKNQAYLCTDVPLREQLSNLRATFLIPPNWF